MDVPPGMDAIEYRAYCFAKADPAKLKAAEERILAKFSNSPGAVNGPSRRECHPPPSPSVSDTDEKAVGLLSPGASEHGEPNIPRREVRTDEPSNEETSESSSRSIEQRGRSSATPEKAVRNRFGKDSRMSKVKRRNRKIYTRTTRSMTSSATSLSQLDDNENLKVELRPTAAVADPLGTRLSYSDSSPIVSAPQVPTETARPKPAVREKRKRGQDDVPTGKRARIETSNVTSSAVLGPAESAKGKPDTIESPPSRIESWLQGQKPVHEPAQSSSFDNDKSFGYTMVPFTEDQKFLLQDRTCKGIPESLLRRMRDRDRKSRPHRHALSDRVPKRISKAASKPAHQSQGATEPSRIQKATKNLKKVHNRKVENLLSAFIATGEYCEALELNREGAELAKICLNEVFHHQFSEYHPTHAIIVACIYFAYGGVHLRRKWGLEVDQFIWPSDIPPAQCGPAIAAVRQFFLSSDSKRMRPKATRRGPDSYPQSSRPSY